MNRFPNLIPGKLYRKPVNLYIFLKLNSGKSINVPNNSILMYISEDILNEGELPEPLYPRLVLTFSFEKNVGTVDFSLDSVFDNIISKIEPITELI